jgi:membrane protein implicated in regulation of membrane protease activity
MRNEKYEEICDYYYHLSSKECLNFEDEQRIANILELAVEDLYLSSLIDEIDEKIYEEAKSLSQCSELNLLADVSKIKRFLETYSAEDEDNNCIDSTPSTLTASESSEAQFLLTHVRNIATVGQPSEVLLFFQKVFIQGEVSPADVKVHSSLKSLAGITHSPQDFAIVIQDCLYIVVNAWLTKPNYHIFITQLISLFDQRELLRFTHIQAPCILQSMLDFTQSDHFIDLFRLSSCIRRQVYERTGSLETVEPVTTPRSPQLPKIQPTYVSTAPPSVNYVQGQKAAPISSVQASFAHVTPNRNVAETQMSRLNLQTSQAEKKSQTVIQKLLGSVQSQINWLLGVQPERRKQARQVSERLGIVVSPILPGKPGKVKVDGVFWSAKLPAGSVSLSLQPGEQIRVVSQQENIYLVEPYVLPNNSQVKVLPRPIIGFAKDPITFGNIGKIEIQGKIRIARLHEGFSYVRLYNNQEIKVVAMDGDLLVITPHNPSPASERSSYEVAHRSATEYMHA